MAELTPLKVEQNNVGGPKKHSIMDGIITGLFGSDTDSMMPAEGAKVERERQAASKDAASAAYSAWKNPGAEYINGSAAVQASTQGSDMIKDVLKMLFAGG